MPQDKNSSAAPGRSRRRIFRWAAVLLLASSMVGAKTRETAAPVTPPEHRRGPEQTFLTFPEWFLVFSPAEYADFIAVKHPSDFPYFGHIGQFWQSYRAVYGETKKSYPFNMGYHVMIMVIGTSTTAEYSLKSAYETLVGRVSEKVQTHGPTSEDLLAARVAQDYVDFIRVTPWYEYDFFGKLAELWKGTGFFGPDFLRKCERKYFLTTEYGVKAVYGKLIKVLTKMSYDAPLLVTAAWVDRLPSPRPKGTGLKVLKTFPDRSVLITLPRYEAFMTDALVLAKKGVRFKEIAGNRKIILMSLLVPSSWKPDPSGYKLLFTQPILTKPGQKRVVLMVPVPSLSGWLVKFNKKGSQLEHVFDY